MEQNPRKKKSEKQEKKPKKKKGKEKLRYCHCTASCGKKLTERTCHLHYQNLKKNNLAKFGDSETESFGSDSDAGSEADSDSIIPSRIGLTISSDDDAAGAGAHSNDYDNTQDLEMADGVSESDEKVSQSGSNMYAPDSHSDGMNLGNTIESQADYSDPDLLDDKNSDSESGSKASACGEVIRLQNDIPREGCHPSLIGIDNGLNEGAGSWAAYTLTM